MYFSVDRPDDRWHWWSSPVYLLETFAAELSKERERATAAEAVLAATEERMQSEKERRVVAQEAITLHWEPKATALEAELQQISGAVGAMPLSMTEVQAKKAAAYWAGRAAALEPEIARLRSIINERCLAIHIHDRTYGVRMWERWVVRELLADPWGPSTGESYELDELLAKAKEQL
jgi:hypothetical protein